MAVEGNGFWLPSEFLTDDDFLMEKENFKTESETEFRFPTEFPYDFEKTQREQLVEKLMKMARAPQSSNGSPNGFISPRPRTTTSYGAEYDAVGDLIYLAAGEVAKLRLNRGCAVPQFHSEAKIPSPSVYLNAHFHQKQRNEGSGMLYNRQPVYQNRGQAAWTLPQNPTRGRSVLYGGSGGGGAGGGGRAAVAKRTCAGTGVFLPRRYENISNKSAHSSDSQRNAGGAPIQFPTKHFANVNGFTQSEPQPHDYYTLMARRHALVLQQRRSMLASLAKESAATGGDQYLSRGNSDISGHW